MGRHLRAREVELEHVGAGFFGEAGEFFPGGLVVAHDGGDEDLVGVLGLEAPDVGEVLLERVLGDLLHVLEADEGGAFLVELVEAGGDLVDEVAFGADGLEDHAAEAGVVGLLAHLVAVADRRGRQAEGVLEMHPQELDGQIFLDHLTFLPALRR